MLEKMKERSIETKQSFFSDIQVDLQYVHSPCFSFVLGSKSQKVKVKRLSAWRVLITDVVPAKVRAKN